MSNRLTDFADELAGVSGSGVAGVQDIQVSGDGQIGVLFEDSIPARQQMDLAIGDTGIEEVGRRETGTGQVELLAQDPMSFGGSVGGSEPQGKRVRPTDIHREPTGRFTYPPDEIDPAPSSPAQRGPNGRFVSTDLEPADEIGRQERTGLFDRFLD